MDTREARYHLNLGQSFFGRWEIRLDSREAGYHLNLGQSFFGKWKIRLDSRKACYHLNLGQSVLVAGEVSSVRGGGWSWTTEAVDKSEGIQFLLYVSGVLYHR